MMFVASQLLAFAIEPLFWVLVFLLPGVLLLRRRPGLARGLVWSALAALLLGAWTPLPELLLRHLESRYPALPAGSDLRGFTGVVVLGGALSRSELWTSHGGKVALNEQAERMTEAVALMRMYPHLKLLFTGGIAKLTVEGLTEAQRAKIFFDQMGVDPARVLYESNARTTYENAFYSARMAGIDKQQPWLLLTSAFHMPRSMGVFRNTGWNVTPYPVDYRSDDTPVSWLGFSLHFGPPAWELVLHEITGYYAYRLAGMI